MMNQLDKDSAVSEAGVVEILLQSVLTVHSNTPQYFVKEFYRHRIPKQESKWMEVLRKRTPSSTDHYPQICGKRNRRAERKNQRGWKFSENAPQALTNTIFKSVGK